MILNSRSDTPRIQTHCATNSASLTETGFRYKLCQIGMRTQTRANVPGISNKLKVNDTSLSQEKLTI